MKSITLEQLKEYQWDRYNTAHDNFNRALFRFNEAADDNFYTKLAELSDIMEAAKGMYYALNGLKETYKEIENNIFTGIYVKNDKEVLNESRSRNENNCEQRLSHRKVMDKNDQRRN